MPPTDKYAWAHNARWVVDELPDILAEHQKAVEAVVKRQDARDKKDAIRTTTYNVWKGILYFAAASFYPVARIISHVFFHYDLP